MGGAAGVESRHNAWRMACTPQKTTALLLLQIDLVDMLLVGDVGGDLNAHRAPVRPANGSFMHLIPMSGERVLELAIK